MKRGVVAWGPAATWAAVLFLLSGITDPPSLSWLPQADKLVHAALYSVLGAALAWARFASGGRAPHVAFILAGILFGAADELRQSFVPGRYASLGDVAADTAGVLLGYGGLTILLTRREEPELPPASRSSGS